MSTITTEAGDKIIQENVVGITGASTLNDTRVAEISTETFTTDPLANGWLIGSGWAWSSVNGNMA